MKGFDITIKNELLEKKHIENMGVAVWLYMWLVDKITSIREDQVGIVLGGKPIKYEEVYKELGISQRTYANWIRILKKYPYIIIKRTPHGLVYNVLKAHKRYATFGKRYAKNAVSIYRQYKDNIYNNKKTSLPYKTAKEIIKEKTL